ncbi:hypothetical protein BT96DRAFT_996225 [Gymnopus androsaceus JB14]|uniref:Uncharacterized protein n=1 Tax=Gymnopus androsaceus JB14 TaxID=1447944 RepID=A0A6A4HGZ8_9AGAR|nr:hypothetical protein BT96DRAFT_996225 [Gymnopus androsaceus JB14]
MDLESWQANVASNFSSPEPRLQDYLPRPERVNSQYHGLFDFRQDYAARKSFGLSLLPAYVHAKKLGQGAKFFHQATYMWLSLFLKIVPRDENRWLSTQNVSHASFTVETLRRILMKM